MEPKAIKFNDAIAFQVFDILNRMWIQKEGVFNNVVLPQDIYPALPDKREYANWFFFACLPMRGGLVSDDPLKWMWQLKKHFPEMFEPEIVSAKWTPKKIEDAFRHITQIILNGNSTGQKGGGALGFKMEEHAKNWQQNAVILARHWGGDVRNVFWGVTEFEEAFRRADYRRNEAGFKGMRRKIFSLFTIFLQEKKLIHFFPCPIPVDFHVLRIFWATDIMNLRKWAKPFMPREKHPQQLAGKMSIHVYEGQTDKVAIWSQEFIQKHGFSHMVINPALWILSRTLCAEQLQNSSKRYGIEFYETKELIANPAIWPKNYRDPCLSCPIEEFCKWAVPSVPYYRWGLLVRIGKRVPYNGPSPRLPFDWTKIPYINRRKRAKIRKE